MIQSPLLETPVSGPQAPAGLAWLPGGTLLMADPLAHRLWRWRPGTLPVPVAPVGRKPLSAPTVVRTDASGQVTVLERDATGCRVRRLMSEGRVATLYEAPPRRDVLDLAVGPDGAVFLALRELTGGPPWVARLAGEERLVPLYGGEGAPLTPELAIATGPDGSLFVLHGEALWRWRGPDELRLVLADAALAMSPYDGSCLAVGPNGRLVLTLAEAGRVLRVNPATGMLEQHLEADPWVCRCGGDGCVHSPAYPAIDAGGRVWAVDGLRRRVVCLPGV